MIKKDTMVYSKYLIGSISDSSLSFPERETESSYLEVHEVWGSLKSLSPVHIPSGPSIMRVELIEYEERKGIAG